MKNIHWALILGIGLLGRIEAVPDIAPHHIQEIPPEGILINEPGTYVFENDISWSPNSDGVAIAIEANGVTLDMKGYTLSSATEIYKSTGIAATECVQLKIQNGIVQNMGLAGITCSGCLSVCIKDVTVDGLYVQDIIKYTVPTGILATGCIDVSIDRCTIENINVRTGSLAAIQMTSTFGSAVTHCKVKNLLNQDGACTGIGHLNCDVALVKSCKLEWLQSKFVNNLNTEGHTAIGLVPVFTTNIKIEECTVSNVIGCCDDAHGMSIFLCEGAQVSKCKVAHVLDGLGDAQKGAKATGIEVYGTNVVVSDCHVKDISAINPEDKQATGFSCAQALGVSFLRCKAENVQVYDESGQQRPELGYGTGFGWAPDPRPEFIFPSIAILYQDCVAKNCQVGFDSWYHIDSVWDHIVSKDNDIPLLNQLNSERTLSCGPCSECGCQQATCFPKPIVVTLTNVADNNIFYNVTIK